MARGHRTRLVTSHRGWPSRVDEDGLEVIRQFRPPERPFNRLGFPAGTSHTLPAWWALRRGDDDVVQGWTAPAALAAAHSGKPSVFVFQGVLNENDLAGRPRVRSMLLRAARGCDVVTAYSEGAAHEFTRLTGIEARAIEPGIRLDAFTPAADRGGAVDGRHPAPAIFCAADPDEPRKRVRLLVDAFAAVRRSRPDVELWVMPTADPVVRGAPGVRVVDPGADRDALVRLYRDARVSVLPAFREAFGLVVVESLACGTPVVGMRDGGAVPQILGPDGFVADPTPYGLARTLLDALDATPDPAACRRIAERYSIERCAQQYEALYEELLAA
jgi:glycosyltransferase involved in cell wall biosynthesis